MACECESEWCVIVGMYSLSCRVSENFIQGKKVRNTGQYIDEICLPTLLSSLSSCARRKKVVCVLKSYTPRPDMSVPSSPVPSERAPLTEHAMRLPHSSPTLQRGEILIEWKDGTVTPLYEAWTLCSNECVCASTSGFLRKVFVLVVLENVRKSGDVFCCFRSFLSKDCSIKFEWKVWGSVSKCFCETLQLLKNKAITKLPEMKKLSLSCWRFEELLVVMKRL